MSATSDLLAGLKDHYRKPGADRDGEILLTEASPPGSSRRADLVRIGLWRSRGPGIDVHELKASRSDWLRELDDKAKAEAWWPYCHRFWIVTTSTDVVEPEELPPGWGLMTPGRGRRFKVVTKPASKEPKVTVALMTELIRRADNARLKEFDRIREEERQKYHERVERIHREAFKRSLDPDVRERLELLERLEEALGVELTTFDWGGRATPERLAEAIGDCVKDHLEVSARRERLDRYLERLATAIDRARSSS